MSGEADMLERLGRFTVRRRRWVLAGTLVAFLAAGAFGGSVSRYLSNGGFNDPNSESQHAADTLGATFHSGNANMVMLVTAKHGSVDAPAVAADGVKLTRQLAGEPGIAGALSYWTLGSPPPLRSTDG